MLAVTYSLLRVYSNDAYSYWNISKYHLLKWSMHEVNGKIMVNINFFFIASTYSEKLRLHLGFQATVCWSIQKAAA